MRSACAAFAKKTASAVMNVSAIKKAWARNKEFDISKPIAAVG
jgi:hypothetical protein